MCSVTFTPGSGLLSGEGQVVCHAAPNNGMYQTAKSVAFIRELGVRDRLKARRGCVTLGPHIYLGIIDIVAGEIILCRSSNYSLKLLNSPELKRRSTWQYK